MRAQRAGECPRQQRCPSTPSPLPTCPSDPAPTLLQLGYPAMVRPSYVLGGRAMEIVYSDADIHRYVRPLGGDSREQGVKAVGLG